MTSPDAGVATSRSERHSVRASPLEQFMLNSTAIARIASTTAAA